MARRVAAVHIVPLAALAFLLLWLEAAAPRLRVAKRAPLALAAIALLAGVIGSGDAVSSLEAQLRQRPGDPTLLLALGVARAEAGDHAAAGRALEAAALRAGEPHLASLAYYDLGVLELDRRRYEAARDAFLDALALHPADRRARFNLEWTLRALQAVPPPEPLARPGEPGADEPEPSPGEEPRANERERPASDADPTSPSRGGDSEVADENESWAPTLDEVEVRRWLEAVGDESGLALRRRAREAEANAGSEPSGPRW